VRAARSRGGRLLDRGPGRDGPARQETGHGEMRGMSASRPARAPRRVEPLLTVPPGRSCALGWGDVGGSGGGGGSDSGAREALERNRQNEPQTRFGGTPQRKARSAEDGGTRGRSGRSPVSSEGPGRRLPSLLPLTGTHLMHSGCEGRCRRRLMPAGMVVRALGLWSTWARSRSPGGGAYLGCAHSSPPRLGILLATPRKRKCPRICDRGHFLSSV
jgi:hypothetical protein